MKLSKEHVKDYKDDLTCVPDPDSAQLSPPWDRYVNILTQIFAKDKEVTVQFVDSQDDDPAYHCEIDCKNYPKLLAIQKLIGYSKYFGNVELIIKYTYNGESVEAQTWAEAFENNPIFHRIETTPDNLPDYAIFSRDVISFYDDNLSTYNKYTNMTTAQAIMEVIDINDVYPCVDGEEE